MLKSIFASILALALLAGCGKSDVCNYEPCAVKASASEIADVQSFITNNGIQGAVQHCSGLFYTIDTVGTGAQPTPCSTVTIDYVGSLTDGTVFDKTTSASGPVTFPLDNLITAWRNGLPFLKAGGTMTLYVPPTLGYGSFSSGQIPANSILIFKIDLRGVQ
jgi:FKBP-type peptidyl-prolyl cis-trans isomerase FkpA